MTDADLTIFCTQHSPQEEQVIVSWARHLYDFAKHRDCTYIPTRADVDCEAMDKAAIDEKWDEAAGYAVRLIALCGTRL